ncbi:PspC domain-containing protein [Pseudoalteromonas sp. SSDWG2]|uniref:PspC domain-containing protein n=1 Tax=Pseudoalteromonas sp. SSDWG2 TaxID=3139391 RepID=UPI003BAA03E8
MARSTSSRFYRDSLDKKLSGLCAGFAKRHALPIWLTRLAVIILFINAPILVSAAYLLGHFIFDEAIVV